MTKVSLVTLFAAALLAAFGPNVALAQSSGSFNYSADTTACTNIGGLLGRSSPQTSLKTTMKVSSGNGVALVVRPSAVVGLLTDVSLSGKFGSLITSGNAQETVQFAVTVTPLSGQAVPTVTPGAPVTFDDRFIQISTNLFGLLTACTDLTPCTFDFNETTLSAHSFDFVVTGLSAGNYGITVAWTASSNSVFVTIMSGNTGRGSGSVSYQVLPNTSSVPRVGTLTVAGHRSRRGEYHDRRRTNPARRPDLG